MRIRVKITRETNPACGKVVDMDVEEYLRGVVPAELYASAPEQALRAQAIAARTYAARKVRAGVAKPFDVDDTSNCQAYRPHDRLHPRTDAAVQQTKGFILVFQNQPIDAVYTASNGGRTVSAQKRWGNAVKYLQEKVDPYDDSGRVSGHGVGMSQRGAVQAARAGLTHLQILAFYYPGCALRSISPLDASAPLRFSLATQGETLLSPNFRVREFRCKDGSDEVLVRAELIGLLQALRDEFARPVNLLSGYRTQEYNSRIGGARQSQHLFGGAADIHIPGIAPQTVALAAQRMGAGGVGVYLDARDLFVHVDVRVPEKVRWVQQVDGAPYRYVADLEEVL